ncbi:sigma-54 dependent transcriptional regulator [Pseudoalteromonas sp. McH1-42]|uniref:sigma-54-dependent transcriptional regulator n=1 Tax=Pseudoalteromonas sp. McH1-42 TaxID=2917752 RepID=UPI001EF41A3D|nr:sigma-54 dependent transcriptional regulator [Pseudoalteromonas sp. McH1-42]MCG7563683.1 sigma-54 dependent transcriptional regulator [Pseudoalteromonas sp. McH1-42]
MPSTPPHILVLDDKLDICLSLEYILSKKGFRVSYAQTIEQGLLEDRNGNPDLVLMDMNYTSDTTSGSDGLALLKKLRERNPDRAIVVMTAWSNTELIVQSMKLGAADFIEKPWQNQRLFQILEQQIKLQNLEKSKQGLAQQLAEQSSTEILWHSPAMKKVMQQVERVSETDASVLILGENGTGKSSLAKYIYNLSPRRDKNLVSVNMGAIPDDLFESEMFGHIKGAFTDAKSDRIGRFSIAHEGTLLLDEIANMSMMQQSKLLRVLESGEYEAVGSSTTQHANVRLICATNAELRTLIEQKIFREDLYYRINTFEVTMPPLRERREDISLLATHFVNLHSKKYNRPAPKIKPSAVSALEGYRWSGNVRELSHVMERAVLLCSSETIDREVLNITPVPSQTSNHPLTTLAEAESSLIIKSLEKTDGCTAEAAKILGLSTSALYRRMEKYQIKYG